MRARFLRFSIIGAAGFVIDAGVLQLAIAYANADPYVGRLISYLSAASFTWALNRRYTFRDQQSHARVHEWARFLASNAVGGLLNYLTYAVLVSTTVTVARYPVVGVAVGSVAGLLVNFTLSRRFVFTGHRALRLPRVDRVVALMALITLGVALTLIVNPWPRDRWYVTQYMLFGVFPGYDNYTPVAVPAWIYFGAHTVASALGLDLEGEFYIAAVIQDVMLFLSVCFLYRALKVMQMARLAAPVAVGFLVVLLIIGLPHTFYSENAAVFLMCGLILTLAEIRQRWNEAGPQFWTLVGLAGALLGLLTATRMTPILLVPLIPVLFWLRMPAWRIAGAVGVMLLIAATLLAGMAMGNHVRFGRYELSNSSGRHLWQGVKDFSDRALASSGEYQALKQQYPHLQGTYWDKIPPQTDYNEIGIADPREAMLGRFAREAILNAPGLYLFHGAKKFVRTIGAAPSQDVFASSHGGWNPLRRKEPLPALVDVMRAPAAIGAAAEMVFQGGYAALVWIYPLSIFFVSLSGVTRLAEHVSRLVRGRSLGSRRIDRWVPVGLVLAIGLPLTCIPMAVFGRSAAGYTGWGLCALALGFCATLLVDLLRKPVVFASHQEDQSWFFFSALAFFGILWFTWQVEFQAPRYAIPYLPFWAIMLATSVLFWKRVWNASRWRGARSTKVLAHRHYRLYVRLG